MQNINDIVASIRRGERPSAADAPVLWREAPLWLLGELATERKLSVSGRNVYYNRNVHLEPSNICLFNCEFCSFRRREGDPDAWAMTMDEVEARAKAEELGIGAVDLSTIDTKPLGVALNTMVDAQTVYYAEEARAQKEYIDNYVPAEVDTSAMTDDSGAEASMEQTVDMSGFVATEEMVRLQGKVDETYLALCEEIKAVFPALTDDILQSLKSAITSVMAAQNDTFEKQYDRAMNASGTDTGMFGWVLRQARTLALSTIGLLVLALAVFFYTPLVKKMGVPRLIITGFLLLLLIMAPFVGADLPTQISNIINRFSWNGIL